MTTSEQRAELVRHAHKAALLGEIRGTRLAELADALEASEAEKARLIEAVRDETTELASTRAARDAVARLLQACDEAEAQ